MVRDGADLTDVGSGAVTNPGFDLCLGARSLIGDRETGITCRAWERIGRAGLEPSPDSSDPPTPWSRTASFAPSASFVPPGTHRHRLVLHPSSLATTSSLPTTSPLPSVLPAPLSPRTDTRPASCPQTAHSCLSATASPGSHTRCTRRIASRQNAGQAARRASSARANIWRSGRSETQPF